MSLMMASVLSESARMRYACYYCLQISVWVMTPLLVIVVIVDDYESDGSAASRMRVRTITMTGAGRSVMRQQLLVIQ